MSLNLLDGGAFIRTIHGFLRRHRITIRICSSTSIGIKRWQNALTTCFLPLTCLPASRQDSMWGDVVPTTEAVTLPERNRSGELSLFSSYKLSFMLFVFPIIT